MGKKNEFPIMSARPLPTSHIIAAAETAIETAAGEANIPRDIGVNDELFVQDGRRFESVFFTVVPGDQYLGVFTSMGMDVGQKYTRGSSPLVSGFFDSEGVDYGQRLFAGANISIVPQSPPVVISGYEGDYQSVVLRYKIIGYWSHIPISVYGRPFKLVDHTYSEATGELDVTVQFNLTLGTQEGDFVVSLADKYTGSTFVSGPTRYKLTGTKRCDCDRRPCGDCYDNDDHCDHCSDSCDMCDAGGRGYGM